jgi:hypothetical protein
MLIQFEYVTDKLVTESEEILEILVYLVCFILFYNICSDMIGEHDTRNNNQMEGSSQHWISPEDGLLLGQNAPRREREKKRNFAYKLENFVLFT